MFGFKLVSEDALKDIQETLTLQQRQLEDIGWINIGEIGTESQMLGYKIDYVIKRCRLYFYKSPLAGHWVTLITSFVFGNGIGVPKAADDKIQDVLTEFWEDQDNQGVMTSFDSQIKLCNKLQYEGNLFFLLTDDEEGNVRVRILDSLAVVDIIKDPKDSMRTLFYKVKLPNRRYDFSTDSYGMNENKVFYYPDIWNLDFENQGVPTNKLVPGAKIFHVKINCDVNDKFGVPTLFRGLDWIKAHKDMAEDVATLIKSLSQFAWKKKIKGTAAKVKSIAGQMRSNDDLSNIRRTAGRTQIENEGVDLKSVDVKTGGVKIGTDGMKSMQLMVSAASGIMYHYFGDPATGNLATAKTMELPMVKMFEGWQRIWESIYLQIFNYLIYQKISVSLIDGTIEDDPKMNRWGFELPESTDATIDVDFPPILEKDLKDSAEGWTLAKDNKLVGNETAAQHFMLDANIDNIDEEIKNIKDIDAEPESEPEPFGTPKPIPVKEAEGPKEEIENQEREGAKALKKWNFVNGRMNSYRKALANDYQRFKESVMANIVFDEKDGVVVGHIRKLDSSLSKLKKDMTQDARVYFKEAVGIGYKYIESQKKKFNIEETITEAANGQLTKAEFLKGRVAWNDEFVTTSLIPALSKKVGASVKTSFASEEKLREAVELSLFSMHSRIEQYVGAFWSVEEGAVSEAGKGTGFIVGFIGPNDASTCEECSEAVANSPYPIDTAPVPGTLICRNNCRHALQVQEVAK